MTSAKILLQRRRFRHQVLAPVLLVAVVAMGIAMTGLWWTTRESDAISVERQVEVTRRTLASSVDEVAYEQQSAAQWHPMVENLAKSPLDYAWLDENCGAWLFQMFGHDHVYIVDAQDKPVYAAIDGVRTSPETFEKSRDAFMPLVDVVRAHIEGKPHQHFGKGTFKSTDATGRTLPGTIHASDLAEIYGRPAAVSAMQVSSPSTTPDVRTQDRFIMVVVQFLDGTYLSALARRSMIDGLRYSQTMDIKTGERIVPLIDDRGEGHGFFMWRPVLPGTKILSELAPITIASVGCLVLALALLARSLWVSANRLDATMSDLQASEAQARRLASHDTLTGLPNRALFNTRLTQAMADARDDDRIAILMIDLDRFKQINDTLGHQAGDSLLQEVGRRLSSVAGEDDLVARLGGDEFIVLLARGYAMPQIEALCDNLFKTMREPFDLLGSTMFVGMSIGIATAPDMANDQSELLRKADIALFEAKAAGRNTRRYFEEVMDREVKRRHQIEDQLRRELEGGSGILVHYQPVIACLDRSVVGFEALVRWNHPTEGLLGPEQFIPIAEETGLISALGERVLREAARVAARYPDLFMAVNLSPVQFRQDGFVERAVDIVRAQGCTPSMIEFEVTEQVLIDDNEAFSKTLWQMRDAGFRIALDDFGTGYSSMSYLRRFRVDKLKIDRSFTCNIGETAANSAIVVAVITMGHAMGLTITAEGVDHEGQVEALAAAGCDQLQGFLFSPAVPEAALPPAPFVEETIEAHNASAVLAPRRRRRRSKIA